MVLHTENSNYKYFDVRSPFCLQAESFCVKFFFCEIIIKLMVSNDRVVVLFKFIIFLCNLSFSGQNKIQIKRMPPKKPLNYFDVAYYFKVLFIVFDVLF